MTDMDEIRELTDSLVDEAKGWATAPPPRDAAVAERRSALLQRVEALREERDAKELEAAKADSWRQAAEAYRRERDRAREVAQHYSDAQDRADERRAAAEAERDAALAAQNRAPSPPETPAPEVRGPAEEAVAGTPGRSIVGRCPCGGDLVQFTGARTPQAQCLRCKEWRWPASPASAPRDADALVAPLFRHGPRVPLVHASAPSPIHWLGDCTQDCDVWELTRRRERFTILGSPTTLYFAMDDGTRIVVPNGWWIYDWHTAHPRVSSAAPSPTSTDPEEILP